jgi:acetylornithine deacetylase
MSIERPESLAEAAVDLAVQLVQIDSVNPGLVPDAPGERRVVDLLADRLSRSGFACDVVPAADPADRPSLVACHGGVGHRGRKSLLFNGHLDTVGVGLMPEPLSARIVGDRHTGRLLGRGSCDMKAGVAALVVAAEAIAAAAPDRPITLALVADEENASLGTEAVLNWLATHDERPALCVVAEPTWLDFASAHRGFAIVEVELDGVAGHSSQVGDGVNAVTHLGRLLGAVEAYDAELRSRSAHRDVGHGSLLATVVSGGSAPFSLAGSARAIVERRTVPGERAADTVAEVEGLVNQLRADDPTVSARCRLVIGREAWQRDGSDVAVRFESLLSEALVEQHRPAPRLVGAPYWMESALWQEAGISTVVCGPAGGGLHADDEWVDLAQVRAFALALADVGTGLDLTQ